MLLNILQDVGHPQHKEVSALKCQILLRLSNLHKNYGYKHFPTRDLIQAPWQWRCRVLIPGPYIGSMLWIPQSKCSAWWAVSVLTDWTSLVGGCGRYWPFQTRHSVHSCPGRSLAMTQWLGLFFRWLMTIIPEAGGLVQDLLKAHWRS